MTSFFASRIAWAALVCLVALCPAYAAQPPVSPQDFPMPRPLSLSVPGLPSKLATLSARPAAPAKALWVGIAQAMSRQYAEAARTLEPVPAALPEMASWAALFRGFSLFRMEDYAAALAVLNAPRQDSPAVEAEILLLIGYCLDAQEAPEALNAYRRFLETGHPFRPVALWRAATVAARTGQDSLAAEYLSELLLSSAWTASADKAEPLAVELFRAGRSGFDPDAPENLRQRIEILLDKSQNTKASALAERLSAVPQADQAVALFLKARALFARRDSQTAQQLFEDVIILSKDPALSAWATYHRARCFWRFTGPGDAAQMEELLLDALRRARALAGGGAELAEASLKLLMLSRLERARFADAFQAAQELANTTGSASEAREQALWSMALISFAQDNFSQAIALCNEYLNRSPQPENAAGAHYWRARAWQASNSAAQARADLRAVLSQWPNGYYGLLASKRLAAMDPADPASAADSERQTSSDVSACPPPGGAPPAEARAAFARADILTAGLLPELAEKELAAAHALQPGDPATALRLARVSSQLGNHQGAVRALSRAFGTCLVRGGRQELLALRDITYPERFRDMVARNLAGSGVEPGVILGLIRQESFFEPEAVSAAGAMGLMQLLPATAKNLAEKSGEKNFSAQSLKDPSVNIRYGVRFFLDRYAEYGGNLPLTLSSYNAGRVKTGLWREHLGALDPELFTECIPYAETRDYVKRIQSNQAMYALLYGP